MSVPTIGSVVPNAGPTRGRRLCKITGTNFALQPSPALSMGKTSGTLKPAVRVFFGTVEADEVHVLSSTLLHVITPAHDAGASSVTVRNVDQDGVQVGAETVTLTNAYTFQRPDFGRAGAEESILVRITRTLLQELKRQLLENVEIAVHTDYANTFDGANVAMLAAVPGLVVSGPTTRENKALRTSEDREETSGGETYQKRPPRTVDLVFTLIGVHEVLQPALNFMQEAIGFAQGNTHLRVLQNPDVPGTYVEFEMRIEEDFKLTPVSTEQAQSNLRSFQGSIAILGIDLDDEDMASRALFDILEVVPTGSVMPSQGVIFVGEPGTTPAAPTPANPPAQLGNTGPFEQFIPEED